MGLTENEIELLRESWSSLRKLGSKKLGLLIFQRLFNDVPHLRSLFYDMKFDKEICLTMEILEQNQKLCSHVVRVVTSITTFIKVLDEPEKLKEFLKKAGEIHRDAKVDPADLEYLAPVMLHVISENLNLESNSKVLQAWVKGYGILRNGMVREMD